MSETAASFSVVLHNQATRTFGSGKHVARIVANNARGTSALATMDMNAMGEAYLAGDIDVEAFLSHEISLDEVNRGFELMEAQDGIRSVIRF